jgi:fructose-bisphosphate aldolase class II
MLVHIKELVAEATKHNYCLGAYNIHNLETAIAVAQAAAEMKSPAIIQVSESAAQYMGVKTVVNIVAALADGVAQEVPLALHLDHGKNIDFLFSCIEAGFQSVHMDGSHLPLTENIAITKQAVDFAHSQGVWVQGEVGALLGGHGGGGTLNQIIPLADPVEVDEFITATGVDTIAAAIGTAHGSFTDENIDFDLLQAMKKKIGKIPFVLHGGSGNASDKILQAIEFGVNIINIGTDIKVGFTQSVIKQAQISPTETDPRKLLLPAIESVKALVMAKMELFGSAKKI